MDRLRLTFFASLLVGLVCVPVAPAQTAANVTVLSGNGQIICETCTQSIFRFFLPMVVKVTDSIGQPIANKTVNWNITATTPGILATLSFGGTTTTDGTGVASNIIVQTSQAGSALLGFLQTSIVAAADNAAATFIETQGLSDANNHLLQFVNAVVNSPVQGTVLTGTAGGLGSAPILVHVDSFGIPVPNVSVRLVSTNDPSVGASATCQTAFGADIGAVLTDANGNASCTPVFGTVSGTGTINALIGGVDATPTSGTTAPIGYFESFNIPISVTPGVAGAITVSSGNGQSSNAGQGLANPLVVRVSDSSGVNPISGAAVTWTISPAGQASLNPTTSTSNAQGLTQTSVTLSTSASGPLTVKAALTANSNIFTTFTVNSIVTVTVASIQKLSGDGQAAIVGGNFLQPLVVQVNSSAGVPANFPVTFSVSGPASIGGQTSTTVNTDTTGKAQVTLAAGASPGGVTVTASAGGQAVSFSETTIPIGPSLTAGSFFNAAGLKPGSLSPCSLVMISASGLAPGVQGTLTPGNPFGPLPLTLGPDRVTFNNVPAPILSVTNSAGQESVTVQVPCEVTPGSSVPVTVNAAGGNATVNVPVQIASPGIFETPMSDGVRRAVAVRPDGSFVSLENPARTGEVIRVYTTGLGTTAPAVGTNSIPIPGSAANPGSDSLVLGAVIVGVDNSGVRLISARLAPTQIGIYEVAFQVDPNSTTGNNVVLSVGINPTDGSATQFSNGSKLPIQ
jgi:uncharacterized protein (TIGR03437 family)